jgi:hypothetical protein
MPSGLVLSNREARPNVCSQFFVLLRNNICGAVQVFRMDEDDDASRFI